MMTCVFRLFFFIIGLFVFNNFVHAQVVESLPTALNTLADELITESKKQNRTSPLMVVLDILNDQTKQRDSLSQQVESLFSRILADKEEYSIVENPQVETTRQEWIAAFPDSPLDQLQADLADILGADWIVTGSFRKAEPIVEFRLQLYEILTQQVIWRGQIQAVLQDPQSQRLSNDTTEPNVLEAERAVSGENRVVGGLGKTTEDVVSLDTNISTTESDDKGEIASQAGLVVRDENIVDKAEMVLIPAGPFEMGSLQGEEDEQPLRSIYLDSYYIDRHEVTNAKYALCLDCVRGEGGFDTTAPNQPVVYVDWENANKYCQFVGKRLPTEAEWEKGARAGSKTEYAFGEAVEQLGEYAWYEENTRQEPYAHVIGLKKPNAWGLYDMHGNVMEWVQDWYDSTQYQKLKERNPQGPSSATNQEYPLRVVRGGAWGGTFETGEAQKLRSGERFAVAPWVRSFLLGFRCVADAEIPEASQ